MWPVEYIIRCEALHFLFGSLQGLVAYFLILIISHLYLAMRSQSPMYGSLTSGLVSPALADQLDDHCMGRYLLLLSFSVGLASHIFADAYRLGF